MSITELTKLKGYNNNCGICGGTFKKGKLGSSCTLIRCTECGLIIRDLRLCEGKARNDIESGGSEVLDVVRLSLMKKYMLARVSKYFSSDKLRMLDVGFGGGFLLEKFAQMGNIVWGIDSSERRIDDLNLKLKYSDNIRIENGFIEDVNLPQNFFEVTYMIHIIEHLKDPIGSLAKINSSLKKGGVLFLVTPDAASKSLDLFKEDWWYFEDPTHYQFFSPLALYKLLRKTGFNIIEIKKIPLESFTLEANSLLRFVGLETLNYSLRNIFTLILSFFFNILRLVVPKMHPSICILARKE